MASLVRRAAQVVSHAEWEWAFGAALQPARLRRPASPRARPAAYSRLQGTSHSF